MDIPKVLIFGLVVSLSAESIRIAHCTPPQYTPIYKAMSIDAVIEHSHSSSS
jgi:hypothetical protein